MRVPLVCKEPGVLSAEEPKGLKIDVDRQKTAPPSCPRPETRRERS